MVNGQSFVSSKKACLLTWFAFWQITYTTTTPEVAYTGDTMSDFIIDNANGDVLRAKVLIVEVLCFICFLFFEIICLSLLVVLFGSLLCIFNQCFCLMGFVGLAWCCPLSTLSCSIILFLQFQLYLVNFFRKKQYLLSKSTVDKLLPLKEL